MTVREANRLKTEAAELEHALNDCFVDHGVVELPEDKATELRSVLISFQAVLQSAIDNAEVFHDT